MEASSVVCHRVSQTLQAPRVCHHILLNPQSTSRVSRLHKLRTIRNFTSTVAQTQRQNASSSPPPQPQPTSQESSMDEAVGVLSPNTNQSKPNTSKDKGRIDLSSLPGLPSSYIPPNQSRPRPNSATAQLNALFAKSQQRTQPENRFERTIRQTDAQNTPSSTTSRSSLSSPILDMRSILDGISFGLNTSSPDRPNSLNTPEKLPLRLHPSLGRSQPVDTNRGVDLARAFRLLDLKCASNGVRRDEISQRFHIRRGQKKKLVRSARWRVAFRKGFLEECARIRRMKNQGW